MRTIIDRRVDFSGGVQSASNWLLRAPNEVEDITNGVLNDEIGRITRRLGYAQAGDIVVNDKPGLGLFNAKFSNGQVVFAATNNANDTATEIRWRNASNSTWTILAPTTLPANTEINMCNSRDEVYIAGKSATSARMNILNVKKDFSVSGTRNLIGAPKARFICEYANRLHAINVELNGTVYADRDYISSPALSVITFTRGAQNTTSTNSLAVDSARYLKPGMAIDIYNHVTQTPRYTNLTIVSVNKGDDTIVLPARTSANVTGVDSGSDVLTLANNTMTITTGTPIVFTTTGSLPAPLSVNTIYYAINQTGTSLRVAASLANANAGVAIDITSTGSGTQTAYNVYTVDDNNEICLTGRYNELCYLWNTDYPTADRADFLSIPSGATSNSEIVGYGKSNNRLFLFTDTTLHRYDQSQLVPIFEDIGCANHQTIKVIGDWLIWLDNGKRVIARNDATGQMEFISRAIKKKYLKDVPFSNLANACAGTSDNVYKLSLGTVNNRALRINYDFDSNNWSHDEFSREFRRYITSTFNGTKAVYMLTDKGKLVQDEIGNNDDGEEIPFRVKFGRQNYGTSADKNFVGAYVFGENMAGATMRMYIDGDIYNPVEIGKIANNTAKITSGQRDIHGRDLNIEIAISSKGNPCSIDGYEVHLAVQEDKFDGTR